MMLTPRRMNTDWMSRRTRNRAMVLLHVPLLDIMADAERRDLDAADPVVDAGVALAHGEEDVRQVLREDALDLEVRVLALLRVELAYALLEQLLDALIDVAYRVELRDVLFAPDLVHPVRVES